MIVGCSVFPFDAFTPKAMALFSHSIKYCRKYIQQNWYYWLVRSLWMHIWLLSRFSLGISASIVAATPDIFWYFGTWFSEKQEIGIFRGNCFISERKTVYFSVNVYKLIKTPSLFKIQVPLSLSLRTKYPGLLINLKYRRPLSPNNTLMGIWTKFAYKGRRETTASQRGLWRHATAASVCLSDWYLNRVLSSFQEEFYLTIIFLH